jgi:hypothetical protein
MSDETAAAILVQTIFDNNEPLRNAMVQAKISNSPDSAAEFIKPYYAAMVNMVQKAR